MKIAVVSAHYMPELGYQEIHLAKAYARLGYSVKVFTTVASVPLVGNVKVKKYETGVSKDDKLGFEILRLPSIWYKSKAISTGLKKEILEFNPEIIVVLGVAKMFPSPILNKSMYSKYKIVSLYGDAHEYLDRSSMKLKLKASLHDLGFKLIKQPLYKRAVQYCDRLVMNIPETAKYFDSFLDRDLKKLFDQKKMMLYLGYDPDEYYFDAELRKNTRSKLGITEGEIVIITSTRIVRKKNIESIIRQVSALKEKGYAISYIIVGFLNDDYEKELKAFIASQSHPEIFKCFPFLNSIEINQLYCAADAGIWLKVAISIQEAMGTGLPVILENKASMNHLVENGLNGWYYDKSDFDTVIKRISDILRDHKTNRESLQKHNASKLSYNNIALKIIENLPEKQK